MTTYPFRIAMALITSEIVPAFVRSKALRALGLQISDEACIWANASFRSKNVKMAAGVFINVGFYHDGHEMLEIERNVRIGPYVRVITASHDIGPPGQRCTIAVVGAPVSIEEGCWIGAGVTILPGVTISKGCVIGAGSLVASSTRANGLYVGTPARRVRDLSTAQQGLGDLPEGERAGSEPAAEIGTESRHETRDSQCATWME